jgi:hypothetical protein
MVEPLSRHRQAALSRKQHRFVQEWEATNGNATEAAARAGYKGNRNTLGVTGFGNLRKAKIKAAIAARSAQFTPQRVQLRLDEIGHAAQAAGQFGPAVRAEELLGKSIGMWIDQSLQLTGVLNDSHIAALLAIARSRQAQPVELIDEPTAHNEGTQSDRDDDLAQ